MFFKNRSKGLAKGVAVLYCGTMIAAAEPSWAEEVGSSGESSFPVVRVDLQAGTFMDPLPFDQAFLIVGQVPVPTEAVEVRLSEYLEAPVTLNEQQLRRFESKMRQYLVTDTEQDSQTGGLDAERVRLKAKALLLEQVQSEGSLQPLRRIWRSVTPWNWGDRSRGRMQAVLAPGTMFDHSQGAGLATTRELFGSIAREARSAQVVTFSSSRTPRPVVRWKRMDQVAGRTQGNSTSEADPLVNWNQLERIRAMRGAPDEDFFSDSGRGGQPVGEETGWRTFRMLIQPLEAQRYYHFDFVLERKLIEDELDAFVADARRQSDGLLQAGTGSLSHADGEQLRALLMESLQRVAGRNALKQAAPVFDSDVSSASVHQEMSRLADDWRQAAEDEGADEPLKIRLENLVRQQMLVLKTSMGASTVDNDYVSGDVGVLYAARIGARSAYIGTNFYLRPLNKNVPLRLKGGALRRSAITVGLTFNSLEDSRRIRSDLYYNSALMLGAGYRISQYWRIGGGGLVFRERDPDSYPLTNKRRTALTPYVALSFDADLGHQLKGIGGLFDFLKGDR